MVIGFDAKRAFLNSSGLGNYARTLLTSLTVYYPENNYILYTPNIRQLQFAGFIKNQPHCLIRQPATAIGKNFGGSIWRSFGLPTLFNQDGIQLYHGLSNELPLVTAAKKVRKIVTIHDLIFMRYPNLYPYVDRHIYKFKFKHACTKADLIFATSAQTKADIIQFFAVPEEKIKVVYQSCNPIYQTQADHAAHALAKQQHQLPNNYLLYVGTIEERKNLLTIVKALTRIKDIPLVVVGKKTGYFDTVSAYIKKHHLQTRILFLENVTEARLVSIYQLATLFIYPSVFEGFGIPIVEALWSKVPVITSLGSCFSEVGGPGTIYTDPLNSEALADKINYLLRSEAVCAQMRETGFNHVQQFHPKAVSAHVMKLYKSLY